MYVLCLLVAIAVGDYSLDLFHLLMCYSDGTATSCFCCNGQPLPRAFFQCSHLLLQFKEHFLLLIQNLLTSKDYHYKTIIYVEASVMFKKMANSYEDSSFQHSITWLVNEYNAIEIVL